MPWQGEGDASRQPYKYQYHPGGNSKNAPKDAPSALNSVIVPNVNLPSVSSVTPGESEQIDACFECILRFVNDYPSWSWTAHSGDDIQGLS
jgi:hypothetical protein